MKHQLYDIVIFRKEVVQIVQLLDKTCVIEDIHTKKQPILLSLIDRKATRDEVKWFCENTESCIFTPPRIKNIN